MKREIHGVLPNGDRVFLGSLELDYAEIQKFKKTIGTYYEGDKPGAFNIASNIYKTQAFIGVEITPLCY